MSLIEVSNELSIRQQCELLGLSRSSYYYVPVSESIENIALMRILDELYLQYPFFGARRMLAHLPGEWQWVNIKRIRRLMGTEATVRRLFKVLQLHKKASIFKLCNPSTSLLKKTRN